jgi:sporulation protein YlmC with PRC-barrel domain
MRLTADVLDQQIIDGRGRKAGKVDGIGVEVSGGAPPRVAYIEMGSDTLARRVSKRLERFARRLHAKSFRVPWSAIVKIDVSVNLNVDAANTPMYEVEKWLRQKIVAKIPFSAHHKHQEKND